MDKKGKDYPILKGGEPKNRGEGNDNLEFWGRGRGSGYFKFNFENPLISFDSLKKIQYSIHVWIYFYEHGAEFNKIKSLGSIIKRIVKVLFS